MRILTAVLIVSSLVNLAKPIHLEYQFNNDSLFLRMLKELNFQDLNTTSVNRLNAGQKLDSLMHFGLKNGWGENDFKNGKNLPKGVLYTKSSDNKIHAFTWAVPLNKGSYQFFGQLLLRKKNKVRVQGLRNISDFNEFDALTQNKWPGGLIYHIQTNHFRRKSQYLALTFRPNGDSVQIKTVEPIIVGLKNIYFGASVFKVKKFNGQHYSKPPIRLMLRYSSSVTASIRSGSKGSEIFIDRLGPMHGGLKNNYADFGPTLATDILIFKRGKWLIK
jgi:hypothetical protein